MTTRTVKERVERCAVPLPHHIRVLTSSLFSPLAPSRRQLTSGNILSFHSIIHDDGDAVVVCSKEAVSQFPQNGFLFLFLLLIRCRSNSSTLSFDVSLFEDVFDCLVMETKLFPE